MRLEDKRRAQAKVLRYAMFALLIVGFFLLDSLAKGRITLGNPFKTYAMGPVAINAQVASDGTLTVTEDRTYSFRGSFNGVYWDIPTGKTGNSTVSIDVEDAGIVSQGGSFEEFERTSSSSDSATSGASGVYTVSAASSSSHTSVKRIKLYSPQFFSTVTFRVVYVVSGGVSAWSDTGELYWKFVSDGWDNPSNNVTCSVTLPAPADQETSSGKVLAWGHGSLDGGVAVTQTGATLTVPQVRSNEYAECRIVFPVSWLSGMTPSTTAKLDSIKSQEAFWADEADATRRAAIDRRDTLVSTFSLLAIGVAAFVALVVALSLRSQRGSFSERYWREMPSDDNPTLIRVMLRGRATERDLTIALMHLCGEGALRMEPLGDAPRPLPGLAWLPIARGRQDYRLILVDDVASKLSDEIDVATVALLVRWGEMVGRENLSLSTMRLIARRRASSYLADVSMWCEVVEDGCAKADLSSCDVCLRRSACHAALILLGGITVIFALNLLIIEATSVVLPMLLIAAGEVALGWRWSGRVTSLTSHGKEVWGRSMALRRWLCDFTRLDEAVPSDAVLWKGFLEMSVVLGVSRRVTEQLATAMPDLLSSDFMSQTSSWCGWGDSDAGSQSSGSWRSTPASTVGSACAAAGTASLWHGAINGSSSGGFFDSSSGGGGGSGSGGGGGFSGGGGGGFGGGGGGGAF